MRERLPKTQPFLGAVPADPPLKPPFQGKVLSPDGVRNSGLVQPHRLPANGLAKQLQEIVIAGVDIDRQHHRAASILASIDLKPDGWWLG